MSKWLENFFASMYTQIMTPHKILGFLNIFFIIIFFFVLNGQKRPNYMLGTLEFCIHLDKKLVPRAHHTLLKSLAPFWIVSKVDSVQHLINRWRRAKIQL